MIIIFITSDGSCRGKKTGRGSDIESNMTLKVTHVGSSPNISLFFFFVNSDQETPREAFSLATTLSYRPHSFCFGFSFIS